MKEKKETTKEEQQKLRDDAWESFSERITAWVGSTASLIVHSVLFVLAFLLIFIGIGADRVLLVLTTIVSLEAIYLSIFIQMTVNRHADSLEDVEEDIEEIQEDVEELSEDVEEISEDIEEIQEDVEEIHEKKGETKIVTLEDIEMVLHRAIQDIEKLKKQ
jgi:peptidoglycan hydrolase CwlO-like protein